MFSHIADSWSDLEIYEDAIVVYRYPNLFHDSYYKIPSSAFCYFGYVSPYLNQIDGEDGYVLNPVFKQEKLAHTITVVDSYIRSVHPFLISFATFKQIQEIDSSLKAKKAQLGMPFEENEWNRIVGRNLRRVLLYKYSFF